MNAPQQETNVLLPVGRLVQGDLYVPQDKDNQGNPLTVKTGPNAGKPRINYFFSVAIPKTPGVQHWASESWGAKIWALGHSWWPGGQGSSPRFAWKIENGDDTTPNQNNKRNCDREGFPGHWVVQCSSSFATKVIDESGNPMLQEGLVKRGYWVEAFVNLASNENAQNPGIYINHVYVAYRAPGAEISTGPDARAIGFGRSALPPGVTAAPIGNTAAMPSSVVPGVPAAPGGAPAVPAVPGVPGVPAVPGAAPAMPGVVPSVPVMPAPQFIAPPVGAPAIPNAPAIPTAPPAAPPAFVCPAGAPPWYRMANPAGGRYEAFKAGGWTDPALLQNGHMVKL